MERRREGEGGDEGEMAVVGIRGGGGALWEMKKAEKEEATKWDENFRRVLILKTRDIGCLSKDGCQNNKRTALA